MHTRSPTELRLEVQGLETAALDPVRYGPLLVTFGRSRKGGVMDLSPGNKAARTRKRRGAGRKAAATRKRRVAGQKAARTRKRRAAARKAAVTPKRRAAVAMAAHLDSH